MAVNSTNYKFNTPTTGTEEDTWGDKLNENWDKMDSLLYGASYTDGDGNTVEQIQPDLAEGSWAIAGTAVTSTAAEINILDGVTATTAEINILDGVTATTAELNILDGVTSTTAELNILDGVTATATELNILDGVTSTTAELNILDGVTATANELNILDGVTATATELNILDGVTATSTEINKLDGLTASTTELNYVDGVTSSIQTQLDAKAPKASPTFTGSVSLGDNVKANFGAGNDLQVYHNGGYNYIYDNSSTNGTFIASDNFTVGPQDASKAIISTSATTASLTYDGTTKLQTNSTGVAIAGMNFTSGGATVDIVRDEDDMSSDDANALATQQSIKAYVDGKAGVAPASSITQLATMLYTIDSGESNKIILPNSLRNYDSLMLTLESSLGVSNFGITSSDYIASNTSTMDRTDFYYYSKSTGSNGTFDMNDSGSMGKTYQTGTQGLLAGVNSEWGILYSDNVSSSGENSFTVRNTRSTAVSFVIQIYGVKN